MSLPLRLFLQLSRAHVLRRSLDLFLHWMLCRTHVPPILLALVILVVHRLLSTTLIVAFATTIDQCQKRQRRQRLPRPTTVVAELSSPTSPDTTPFSGSFDVTQLISQIQQFQ